MNREFIQQRIAVFAGTAIDPNTDSEVIEMLKRRFNIHLPQRPTLDEALKACISDHEIINLISDYRAISQ